MKRFFSLILPLCLVFSFCGCLEQEPSYRSPTTLEDFSAFLHTQLEDSSLVDLNAEEIAFTTGITPSDYTLATVIVSTSGAVIDEVGIFVANEDTIEPLTQKLTDYLENSKEEKRTWLRSYNPQEAEKLENGRLTRYGNCLIYTFLSESDRGAFEKFTEKALLG